MDPMPDLPYDSREHATQMFLGAHRQFADYLDVSTQSLHSLLQEDYGRPFLKIAAWSNRPSTKGT